ncbi:phospholipase A and acyltransferase 2-like isoform X2 [Eretmochelys imbricata]
MPLKGEEPKPGDLIEISRFGYWHWALYVGYGHVIHLAPPSEFAETGFSSLMSVVADKAMVRKEPLWAVVKGDDYWVNNKHDGKLPRRTVDQIIQEAESLVGKTMPYSVTSKNCEHFVTKLRYGPRCHGCRGSGDRGRRSPRSGCYIHSHIAL